MPSHQSRNVMLTVNNPPPEASEGVLPVFPYEQFVAWQLERGEQTGTPHVQAYIEFKRGVTFHAINAALVAGGWPQGHCEERNGTGPQAVAYVTKEDTREAGPWQRGTPKHGTVPRADSEKLSDQVIAHLREHKDVRLTLQEFPRAYLQWGRKLHELAAANGWTKRPRDEGFQPRPWQQFILQQLSAEPDDRTIFWVFDQAGNSGKSRLTRHLVAEHKAQQLEGRVADMAYAFDEDSRIVIFDLTRAQAENVDHLCTFAEKLKNGSVCSTKYESRIKVFDPPHVIFFANIPPPDGKFSADRLKVWNIGDPAFIAALPGPAAPEPDVIDLTQDDDPPFL